MKNYLLKKTRGEFCHSNATNAKFQFLIYRLRQKIWLQCNNFVMKFYFIKLIEVITSMTLNDFTTNFGSMFDSFFNKILLYFFP